MDHLLQTPLFLLFGIIAAGMAVGAIRIYGVSLGAAGVFFVALVMGHFQYKLPAEVTELGLVLFVYAVGLQAGPRFIGILRSQGLAFVTIGLASTLLGAGVTLILAKVLGLSPHMAAGIYAGATTCTPALAAALETVTRFLPQESSVTSVGYGAAYPFSIVAVVLIVQLLPRWLHTQPKQAAERYQAEEADKYPPLEECAFHVDNPNCGGKTIDELQSLHMANVVICRVKQGGKIRSARPDTVLNVGDIVLAVGAPDELAKLETLLGDVSAEPMYDPTGNVSSQQIVVSRRGVFWKTLGELCLWERFGVLVTRVIRDRMEFTPRGNLTLEPGDVLRTVGPRKDLEAVAAILGREERALDETSLVPFAAGLALGAVVGQIPIPLPGGLEIRLGLGGGAFLVALLLGHLGTIGPLRMYVPGAAKHFARDLGLAIFLAGAGTGAGARFVPIVQETGLKLLLAGAVVTLVTSLFALVVMLRLFRWNMLYGAGAMCACMTNPPGLAAATGLAESDAAAVGFASVYPVALIAKIIWAPLIFLMLR